MKRGIVTAVLVFICFILQTSVFELIKLAGITPNILLILISSVAVMRGQKPGMIVGFFSGLLADLFFGTSIGFYALIYMLIGYGNGLLGQVFYTEFINMPVILCTLSEILFSLYVYVFSFLLKGQTNILFYIWKVMLPELVYTVLMTLVIYKFLLWLNARFAKMTKRSAKKFV